MKLRVQDRCKIYCTDENGKKRALPRNYLETTPSEISLRKAKAKASDLQFFNAYSKVCTVDCI